MVKNFLFLLLLCPCFQLLAQNTNTNSAHSLFEDEVAWRSKMVGVARNYLSVSTGISLPQGLYASVYEKEQAGYAQIGMQTNLNMGYYWSANMGFCSTIGFYTNKLNAYNYLPDLHRQLDMIPENGSLQKAQWRNIYLGSGVCLTLPEKKFTFDLQLMGGIVHTTSPHIVYNDPDSDNNPIFEQTSKSAVAPALFIGTSLQLPLTSNGNWCLLLKGNYVGAKPHFQITQSINAVDYKVTSSNDFRQSISSFNLGVGIARQFKYAPNRKKVYHPN